MSPMVTEDEVVPNGDCVTTEAPEASDTTTEAETPVTSAAIVIHSRAKTTTTTTSNYSKPIKPRLGAGLEDAIVTGTNRTAGLVGLSNLGNTCYMNSSLQCLLHTVPFMRSFLSGQYRQDLNRVNPLGQKGELAESFAALMASVWQSGVQYVTPRSFKAKIGRFCPVFTGYGQQDSQELLAFLLDGLHEDLNRIKEKPYNNSNEDEDHKRPDDEVAAAQWALHRSRNDSLVVDHCLGLYRSTLVCPCCSHTSRKFDPVMYLSLPLPESRQRSFSITLIHVDGSQAPTKYMVEVPSVGTVKELLHALAKLAGIEVAPPSVATSRVTSRVTSVATSLDALGAGVAADGGNTGSGPPSLQGPGTASSAWQPGVEAVGPSGAAGAVRPQDVLLLARITQGGWNESVEVFSDVKTRVSEIVPTERSYQLEFLVCYRYPSAQWGPGNKDLRQVVLHHRRRKANMPTTARPFAAPLVLLLPTEVAELQPEQLRQEGSMYDAEYIVNEQAPLMACLRQALLPFHTAQPEAEGGTAGEGQEAAAAATGQQTAGAAMDGGIGEAAGSTGEAAGAPAAAAESENLRWGLKTSSLEDAAEGASGSCQEAGTGQGEAAVLPESNGTSSQGATAGDGGQAGMDAADAHSLGNMDWESSAAAASAAIAEDDGDEDGAGERRQGRRNSWNGASTSAAAPAAGPSTQPFNMWAGQEAAAGAQAGSGEVAEAEATPSPPQPAFLVQVCPAGRMDKRYMRGSDSMQELCTTHTFTVNWLDPAPTSPVGGAYDAQAMEQPTPHESWLRAEEQAAQGRRPVTLAACFEAFLQPEQLSEDDSWYCPKCKDHVEADKKLDLWQLPEVLVVHLKRFCYTRSHREKLCTPVDFPLEGLDLSRYLLRPQGTSPVYDCYAVSNHFGGLGGGHYTAYCRMPESGQWHCFDDSHVSPAEPADVMSPAAYVLFYRRRADAARDPPDMLQQLFEARAQQEAEERAAAERSRENQDLEHDQDGLRSRADPADSGTGARGQILPPGELLEEPTTRRLRGISSDNDEDESSAAQEASGGNYGSFAAPASPMLGPQAAGHASSDDNDLYGAADSADMWDGIGSSDAHHTQAAAQDASYLFIQAHGAGGDRAAPNSPTQSGVIRQPGSSDDEAVDIGLDDEESSGQDGMALMSTSPNA